MDFLSAAGKPPAETFCISWPRENMTRWTTGAGSLPALVWLQAPGTPLLQQPWNGILCLSSPVLGEVCLSQCAWSALHLHGEGHGSPLETY